jgi:hypothetical protein
LYKKKKEFEFIVPPPFGAGGVWPVIVFAAEKAPVTPEVAGSSPVSPQRAASDLQSRVHH